MKLMAKIFVDTVALGLASYLVCGPDRVMILTVAKVMIVQVIIVIVVGVACEITRTD